MSSPDARERGHLLRLVDGIGPWDEDEDRHRRQIREWIDSGAPLYRRRKPDVPPVHLVIYAVLMSRGRILMVDHRLSGLRLPPGGHVEPDEQPWHTVRRESHEELGVDVVAPDSPAGERPFFVTWDRTRGAGQHTDVSLWYLAQPQGAITSFDQREFTGISWMNLPEILAAPIATMNPNMHRFARKLQAAY